MRLYRKGQHVVCAYHGDNGDLIVGRVESVRSNGDVILRNLLTDNRSVKGREILSQRNVIVSKRQAQRVVDEASHSNAKEARKLAVVIANGTKSEPTGDPVEHVEHEETDLQTLMRSLDIARKLSSDAPSAVIAVSINEALGFEVSAYQDFGDGNVKYFGSATSSTLEDALFSVKSELETALLEKRRRLNDDV
jgi:hypothetical protein